MKKNLLIIFLFVQTILNAQTIFSPDGKLKLQFKLDANGTPTYQLWYNQSAILYKSNLGFELKNQASLNNQFTIKKADSLKNDKTWKPVWGEVSEIRDNYNELTISLMQPTQNNREMIIRFRLYNDGLGFRYEFPEQPALKNFIIENELTEFAITCNHKTFWIPGDFDTNEYPYFTTRISEIDASKENEFTEISTRSIIAPNAVQTPLMLKTDEGLYINIFEAAQTDYPAMHLMVDKQLYKFTAQLVPDAVGNKAYMQAPCHTPWRTVLVTDKATKMLESKTILNLNEPNKIADVSWIKPQKMIGIWWGMHVGTMSWNYSDVNNVKIGETDWKSLKPNGKHGATTENTMKYIDFAAENGFDGILVEGWNVGWEDWFGNWKENVFDFVTPYPDFDVEKLQKYAQTKGVKLIMHHETSASVTNYERRLDNALDFMVKHGYNTVKTGYVGRIIPRGEYHDGQWMTRHFNFVAEKMAERRIMLDAHEPVRPTGQHRTWPNWLACEAARGNEFNGWSKGNPPEHECILPFTRLMGGPMDYTPGIFQIKLDYYQQGKKEQVHTTLVKQLALYVTMYSPLQMAADLPENYLRFKDAFQFIKDVAVDWDNSICVEAEPGDYITYARKAKGKNEWFIGSITDENSRTAQIPLQFIPEKETWVATLYTDAANASWDKNPMSYNITKVLVTNKTILKPVIAPGGGAAISLKPATEADKKSLKNYK